MSRGGGQGRGGNKTTSTDEDPKESDGNKSQITHGGTPLVPRREPTRSKLRMRMRVFRHPYRDASLPLSERSGELEAQGNISEDQKAIQERLSSIRYLHPTKHAFIFYQLPFSASSSQDPESSSNYPAILFFSLLLGGKRLRGREEKGSQEV